MRVAALALLISTRGALAGMCEPACQQAEVENLEQRAASKTADGTETFGIFIRDNVEDMRTSSPKLVLRMVTACDKILGIKPDDASCVSVMARLGKADIGTHDIVAALARRPNQVFDRRTIEDFAAVQSPKAEPIVIARWKELAPEMTKKASNADVMNDWAAWRGLAAQALAAGAADARTFLTEQLELPKLDRGVKRACQAALLAIDKRAAKK